jgi:hypothetical protein
LSLVAGVLAHLSFFYLAILGPRRASRFAPDPKKVFLFFATFGGGAICGWSFFAAGFFGCVSRFRPRKTPLRHFRPIFVDWAEFVPIYHGAGTRGEFARCGRHFETQHPLKLYQNYEN